MVKGPVKVIIADKAKRALRTHMNILKKIQLRVLKKQEINC